MVGVNLCMVVRFFSQIGTDPERSTLDVFVRIVIVSRRLDRQLPSVLRWDPRNFAPLVGSQRALKMELCGEANTRSRFRRWLAESLRVGLGEEVAADLDERCALIAKVHYARPLGVEHRESEAHHGDLQHRNTLECHTGASGEAFLVVAVEQLVV